MMKSIFLVGALGALTACGGTTIPMAEAVDTGGIVNSGGGSTGAGTPSSTDKDQSFKKILNNMRIGNGSGGVSYDSRLDAAAQGHADDMVKRGYFSHDADGSDTDGKSTNRVNDRVTAQGYNWIAVGENLGGGQQTEAEVLEDWQNSPSHNKMMNDDVFEDFGLAVAGKGANTRWVLVMATER